MLITYFDEVKYQQGTQPYFWLGGLIASAEDIWSLEEKVSSFAQECFKTSVMSRDTEFHAADIYHRNRNFKEWRDAGERARIIIKLIDIITSHENVGKIYVRIDPSKMIASDYDKKAFMFFIEKVEDYLKSKKSPGILIGDREDEKISGTFAEMLSEYRFSGTSYEYDVKLEHLIDTVHFTSSHHSRMLQLADLYIWVQQFCSKSGIVKYPAPVIMEHIRRDNRILMPNRYKQWPTERSWIAKMIS